MQYSELQSATWNERTINKNKDMTMLCKESINKKYYCYYWYIAKEQRLWKKGRVFRRRLSTESVVPSGGRRENYADWSGNVPTPCGVSSRCLSLTFRGCGTLRFPRTAGSWAPRSWSSPTVSSLPAGKHEGVTPRCLRSHRYVPEWECKRT